MPFKRSAGGPLIRDLHMLTEDIDSRKEPVQKSLDYITSDLRERVDRISDEIMTEEKEKSRRVGMVEKVIADYELARVQEALRKYNKVTIDAFEFKELQKLEKEADGERAKKRQKLTTEVEQKVREELRAEDLKFAERFAKCEALEAAFQAERQTLTETIEALRVEIESQKRLTTDIAKAAAQPPPIQVMRGN